jgi:serine/threonine-protein kinase
MDPNFVTTASRARFEREAQAAAQLPTPHVIQIFDHGVDEDGTPFIVMELLQGEDLSQCLKRVNRLALPEAAQIAVHIGRALRRAHQAGIVHRDLKPQNVFLAWGDEGLVTKILDFGVAKARLPGDDSDTTQTGDVIGSPKYMSPEQARGLKNVDHRSDLWSLGVILFRAVTGSPPFDGESATDVIVKICSDPVPPASSIAPDLSPAVDAFFAKALARAPEDRFQSATELVNAFAELAGGRNERLSSVEASHGGPPRVVESVSRSDLELGARPSAGTLTNTSNAAPRTPARKPRAVVGVVAGGVAVAVCVVAVVGGMLGTRRSAAPDAQGAVAPTSEPTVPPASATTSAGAEASSAPQAAVPGTTEPTVVPASASAPSAKAVPSAAFGPRPFGKSAPGPASRKPEWGY